MVSLFEVRGTENKPKDWNEINLFTVTENQGMIKNDKTENV
jgi:hypothetical protein